MPFNLRLTLKAVVLATVSWIIITNFDSLFDAIVISVFHLPPTGIRSYLIQSIVSLLIGLLVLYAYDVNLGDILGEVL